MKTPTLAIPEACLKQHVVVLGKTGSGKSSTLRHLVEWLLSQGKRVCVIDPKGDWYGLPSSADGKGDGFPVILFGDFKADRSDVPMDAHAGKELAQLIGKSKQACVLGFNGWTVQAMTQFWIDFAQGLFKENQGELYLVIDEVHNFAPKGKVLDPQSGRALHWTNRLASEGRGLGLRLLMASQRPQKVHNDTLTSCETLVAMRVIHASDRNAVKEWIDGCGDGTSGKAVLDGLASMKRGNAWVWCPDAMFLERVEFPKFTTYDSFSEDAITVPRKWATVDIDDVKARLSRVVEQAKENDPKELRKRITSLEAQLKQAQKEKPAPEPKIETVNVDVLTDSDRARIEEFTDTMQLLTRDLTTALGKAAHPAAPQRLIQQPTAQVLARPRIQAPQRPESTGEANGELKPAHLRVLKALYWTKDEAKTPEKVAFLAEYTVNGHFNNLMGNLRSGGYVEGWDITDKGIWALPPGLEEKPTGKELREWWRPKLSGIENDMLDILMDRQGQRCSMEWLCSQIGKTVNGHSNNSIGHLRSIGIAEGYDREGGIKAADVFFE